MIADTRRSIRPSISPCSAICPTTRRRGNWCRSSNVRNAARGVWTLRRKAKCVSWTGIFSVRDRFAHQAEWRRGKAEQYPDDDRNIAAAEALERLATTVKDVKDDFAMAYAELFADDDDNFRICELEGEMLKAVGFHNHWDTAEDFIKDIIAKMTSGDYVMV